MANLHVYTKDGIELKVYDASSFSGFKSLDYIGNSQFLVSEELDVNIGILESVNAFFLKIKEIYSDPTTIGQGVACLKSPVSFAGEGDDTFFLEANCEHFVKTSQAQDASEFSIELHAIDGTFINRTVIGTTWDNIWGCCFDGNSLIVSYENGGPKWQRFKYSNNVWKVIATGGAVFTDNNFDLAFDGEFVWGIAPVDIFQYDIDMTKVLRTWSGPGRNQGITTDGEFIYVLAAV